MRKLRNTTRKKYLKTGTKKKNTNKTSSPRKTKKTNYKQIQNFYDSLRYPEKNCNHDKVVTLRSSYEIKYCMWLDIEDEIVKWSSEDKDYVMRYVFPYEFANGQIITVKPRIRRYFTDFYYMQKSGKEIIVEVKPKNQTIEPNSKKYKNKKSYNYALYTYYQNRSKWQAAKEFCATERKKGRKIYFKIITEKELCNLNLSI